MDEIAVPETLLHWAPPPRSVRYARCGKAANVDFPRETIMETWSDPVPHGGRLTYRRITEREVNGQRKVIEDALVGYGPDGLVDLGVFVDGEVSPYDPPQVVLPPAPEAGMKWSAEHTRNGQTTRRSVEVMACTEHPNCLVSVAEIERTDALLVLRVHFVETDGFFGYEALIQGEGRPTVRTWTEAVSTTTRRP